MGMGEKDLEPLLGRDTELEPLLTGPSRSTEAASRTLTHQTAKGMEGMGDTHLGVHPLPAPKAPTLLN